RRGAAGAKEPCCRSCVAGSPSLPRCRNCCDTAGAFVNSGRRASMRRGKWTVTLRLRVDRPPHPSHFHQATVSQQGGHILRKAEENGDALLTRARQVVSS